MDTYHTVVITVSVLADNELPKDERDKRAIGEAIKMINDGDTDSGNYEVSEDEVF